GFARVSHSMDVTRLGWARSLGFFRGDLLVGFLIVPAILLFLARLTKRTIAAAVSALVSLAFWMLFLIQLRSLEQIGRYMSLSMMGAAAGWGLHEPDANLAYVSLTGIAIFVGGAVAIVLAAAWAWRVGKRRDFGTSASGFVLAAKLCVVAILLLLGISWDAQMQSSPYQKSVFVRSVSSLWTEDAVDTGEFAAFDFGRLKGFEATPLSKLTPDEISSGYRRLANAPPGKTDLRYFAKDSGDNVIFFVLETAPYEFLSPGEDMSPFPNLTRLSAHSFVAERHYTTLPYTACALFSVFTSWYPMDGLKAFGFPPGDVAATFFPELNARGYETAVYSPLHYPGNEDEGLYSAVGITHHIFLPADAPLPVLPGYENQPRWKSERIGADVATLHTMESQLGAWIAGGHPFAAAFVPQAGHFPYPDLATGNNPDDIRARGRALIAMQDEWLGELMNFLAARCQLEKTIIAVFGDHGRRTLQENPRLPRGTIDDSVFHVPLFLYAPRALDQEVTIPWITSHIDIAPTILDLLGMDKDRGPEQGAPLWSEALKDRTTFLLGEPILGADGYTASGKFYMWHHLSKVVYENSEARFGAQNFVSESSPLGREIKSRIRTLVALDAAWQNAFAHPASKNETAKAAGQIKPR
ncbi:MAG: LTA synthase family protein, partial [Candidatus Acidiferrales bacterium]